MGRLDGRVAVVTGAASGIGLATAKLFSVEGATVIMVDVDAADLNQAAGAGGAFDPVVADTSQVADLERLRDRVASTHGKLDILFANAGVAAFSPLPEMTEDIFDRVATINFKGTYFTVQTLLPVLRDGASVILTSSMSGFKGQPAFSAYAGTKAAIRSMARTFTVDLKDRRIRVNAISPGNIETAISKHGGMSAEETKAFFTKAAGETPLGRNGRAEDIAAAALYLASDDSAFVTASELVVDGGFAQI